MSESRKGTVFRLWMMDATMCVKFVLAPCSVVSPTDPETAFPGGMRDPTGCRQGWVRFLHFSAYVPVVPVRVERR